jgi:hypothetical protein
MTHFYRITPLEKKSIVNVIDMKQVLQDGSVRGFTVRELFRWGLGFRKMDDPITNWDIESGEIRFDPSLGWGSELDDLVSVSVEFDGEFTEQERQYITDLVEYETEDAEGLQGTQWLFDGDHDWRADDDYVVIIGPVQIDIVDDAHYNEVLESGITPQVNDVATATDWPFHKGN